MNTLQHLFDSVIEGSFRSAILLGILLVLRPVLRPRVPAYVVFAGWIVIGIGLLFPMRVPVRWSPLHFPHPLVQAFSPIMTERGATEAVAPASPSANRAVAAANSVPAAPALRNAEFTTKIVAAVVWISVALGLALLRASSAFGFWRSVRTGACETDGRLRTMVDQVAAELNVRGRVSIAESKAVGTPAVCGLWRPVLLFPSGFAEAIEVEELRWVILHELGHWKRRDGWSHALLAWGRIVHWFNPLVWLTSRAVRLDCELACDEFVLAHAKQETTHEYGAVLLKVMSFACDQPTRSTAMGIFESKQQLKSRIHMIANYRGSSVGRVIMGASVVAALGAIALTRESKAQTSAPTVTLPPVTASSAAAATPITLSPPPGWFVNGTHPKSYVVGLDATEAHVAPVSSYIKSIEPDIPGFGGMMQSFEATAYVGKRVRFSAWIKTAAVSKSANIWMRIDGAEGTLRFDNIQNRQPSGTKDWQHFEVVLDVGKQATGIFIGFFVAGTGEAWFNDAKFEVVDSSVAETDMPGAHGRPKQRPAAPQNLSFESGLGT